MVITQINYASCQRFMSQIILVSKSCHHIKASRLKVLKKLTDQMNSITETAPLSISNRVILYQKLTVKKRYSFIRLIVVRKVGTLESSHSQDFFRVWKNL